MSVPFFARIANAIFHSFLCERGAIDKQHSPNNRNCLLSLSLSLFSEQDGNSPPVNLSLKLDHSDPMLPGSVVTSEDDLFYCTSTIDLDDLDQLMCDQVLNEISFQGFNSPPLQSCGSIFQ